VVRIRSVLRFIAVSSLARFFDESVAGGRQAKRVAEKPVSSLK
jgi:hypothetical protein